MIFVFDDMATKKPGRHPASISYTAGVLKQLDRLGRATSRINSKIENIYVFLRVRMSNVFKVTTLKILRCVLPNLSQLYPPDCLLGFYTGIRANKLR